MSKAVVMNVGCNGKKSCLASIQFFTYATLTNSSVYTLQEALSGFQGN